MEESTQWPDRVGSPLGDSASRAQLDGASSIGERPKALESERAGKLAETKPKEPASSAGRAASPPLPFAEAALERLLQAGLAGRSHEGLPQAEAILNHAAAVAAEVRKDAAAHARALLDEAKATQAAREKEWTRRDQALDKREEMLAARIQEETTAHRRVMAEETAAQRKLLDEELTAHRKQLAESAAAQRERWDKEDAARFAAVQAERKRFDEEVALHRARLDAMSAASRDMAAERDAFSKRLIEQAGTSSGALIKMGETVLNQAAAVEDLSKKVSAPQPPRVSGVEVVGGVLTQLLKSAEVLGKVAIENNPKVGVALEKVLTKGKQLAAMAEAAEATTKPPETAGKDAAGAAAGGEGGQVAPAAAAPSGAMSTGAPVGFEQALDFPLSQVDDKALTEFLVAKYGKKDEAKLTTRDLLEFTMSLGKSKDAAPATEGSHGS